MTIDTDYSCANIDAAGHETERDESTCFNDAFGDSAEFVALDDENKIRVNLLKPVLASGKKERTPESHVESKSPRMLPPNKGDAFDRVAACMEADRLVPLCRKQNFTPPKTSAAAYGGYDVDLPDLPQPPKGYKLEPSASTCEVIMQWQNYCRMNNK